MVLDVNTDDNTTGMMHDVDNAEVEVEKMSNFDERQNES
jgi:hypothetical protein